MLVIFMTVHDVIEEKIDIIVFKSYIIYFLSGSIAVSWYHVKQAYITDSD